MYTSSVPLLLPPTSAKDIRLQASDNSSEATEWSREVMRTQYEWLFINMTVTTRNATDLEDQDIIVYTVCLTRYRETLCHQALYLTTDWLCLSIAILKKKPVLISILEEKIYSETTVNILLIYAYMQRIADHLQGNGTICKHCCSDNNGTKIV